MNMLGRDRKLNHECAARGLEKLIGPLAFKRIAVQRNNISHRNVPCCGRLQELQDWLQQYSRQGCLSTKVAVWGQHLEGPACNKGIPGISKDLDTQPKMQRTSACWHHQHASTITLKKV